MEAKVLEFKWGKSRGRDTYGYNICTLQVDGAKVASCNGGGYDMKGTCLGDWVARTFAARLLRLRKPFHGLSFHDPNYKTPAKVAEREAKGESLGLERYQAFYSASSPIPTRKHRVPSINGACGFSSVESIMVAIGLKSRYVKEGLYIVTNGRKA